MYNKTVNIAVWAALICFNGMIVADGKVGVVDSVRVMNSEVSKPFQAQVSEEQAKLKTQIEAMDANIEKSLKAFQAKAKVADVDTLEKERDALTDAKNKRDLAAKSAEEKIQRTASKAMEQFGKLVQDAAQQLVDTKGYSEIKERSTLIAFDKKLDITDELIATVKNMQANTSKSPAVTTPAPKK